jgi:hypothetical protein
VNARDLPQGENVERTKIAMTAPVTTLVLPGEGPLCANTFTVSFYAPDKYQDGTGGCCGGSPVVCLN